MWKEQTLSFEVLRALSISEDSDRSAVISAVIEGITDSWSEWIAGFEPTAYKLGLLARRYVSLARSLNESNLCGEKKPGPSLVEYFAKRMSAIQKTLGAERLRRALGCTPEE
jgi:hypothetical protein